MAPMLSLRARLRRFSLTALALGLATIGFAGPSSAEEAEVALMKPGWSFSGPFGTFDRAALQRGFQVYKEICSGCHALNELYYRNFGALGFSDDEVKAVAATAEVQDGPNDQGEMFTRPGRPSDHVVKPFANEKAARAANNGAAPPDLALVVKAREGGPDYVYSLLNGYRDPPKEFKLGPNMYYNEFYPGHQIAMPQPLQDGSITFADGTANPLPQEAHDVVTFLNWAAEPELETRKRAGVKVIIFLLVMTGLFYVTKRRVWAAVH